MSENEINLLKKRKSMNISKRINKENANI